MTDLDRLHPAEPPPLDWRARLYDRVLLGRWAPVWLRWLAAREFLRRLP